jgi:hypothetical protein
MRGPIVKYLFAKVKAELLAQYPHDKDNTPEFQNRWEGAKNVLHILEDAHCMGTGIPLFIRHLTHTQLQSAKYIASTLLVEHKKNGAIPLYAVFSRTKAAQWFSKPEQANEHFIRIISEYAANCTDDNAEVSFDASKERRLVAINEVADYLPPERMDVQLPPIPELGYSVDIEKAAADPLAPTIFTLLDNQTQCNVLTQVAYTESMVAKDEALFCTLLEGANVAHHCIATSTVGPALALYYFLTLDNEQLENVSNLIDKALSRSSSKGYVDVVRITFNLGNGKGTPDTERKLYFFDADKARATLPGYTADMLASGPRYPNIEIYGKTCTYESLINFFTEKDIQAFEQAHPDRIRLNK